MPVVALWASIGIVASGTAELRRTSNCTLPTGTPLRIGDVQHVHVDRAGGLVGPWAVVERAGLGGVQAHLVKPAVQQSAGAAGRAGGDGVGVEDQLKRHARRDGRA